MAAFGTVAADVSALQSQTGNFGGKKSLATESGTCW
jgi:hypothetical protein